MAKRRKNKGLKKLKGLERISTTNGRVFVVDGKEYRTRADVRNNNYIGKVFATPAEPIEDTTITTE
jgi:hypothetical protein